jgi:hypothetical protein
MKLASLLILSIFVAVGCQNSGSGKSPASNMNDGPTDASETPAEELAGLEEGLWGSEKMGLKVTSSGATFDFECGHGKIKQKITPDANGNFEVTGTITHYLYGIDSTNQTFDAEFFGDVQGETLLLNVVWENEEGLTNRENFTLTKGAEGPASQCTD